ncbi:MAG: HIRAN domain-containing protein [Pseudomonadota bacterium]
MDELTLAVVGVQFSNADKSNRRFEVELCRPGDSVLLRPEPRNKLDPRAIGVWREGGGQMGYVTAERCGLVGQRMQGDPVVARFQGFDGVRAYIRVRFGGDEPTMSPAPQPRAVQSPNVGHDGFFADPDGPEFGA